MHYLQVGCCILFKARASELEQHAELTMINFSLITDCVSNEQDKGEEILSLTGIDYVVFSVESVCSSFAFAFAFCIKHLRTRKHPKSTMKVSVRLVQ